MNTTMTLSIILISALITFSLRILPFIFLGGKKKIPSKISKLGEILPSAIMAILIVYCLKDICDNFLTDGIWRLLAVIIVAVSYKWKHNTLISILLGTISYMALLHI